MSSFCSVSLLFFDFCGEENEVTAKVVKLLFPIENNGSSKSCHASNSFQSRCHAQKTGLHSVLVFYESAPVTWGPPISFRSSRTNENILKFHNLIWTTFCEYVDTNDVCPRAPPDELWTRNCEQKELQENLSFSCLRDIGSSHGWMRVVNRKKSWMLIRRVFSIAITNDEC